MILLLSVLSVRLLCQQGLIEALRPPSCLVKGLPAGGRSLNRVSQALRRPEEPRTLLLDLDGIELVTGRPLCLLYLDVLQALNWLLLHLERELLIDVPLGLEAPLGAAPASALALLRRDGLEGVKGECLCLGHSRAASARASRRIIRLDKVERVPEVLRRVLQEVEAWTVTWWSCVLVAMLLPCAVNVELPPLVSASIVLLDLVQGHNNIPVHLAGHLGKLFVEAGIYWTQMESP